MESNPLSLVCSTKLIWDEIALTVIAMPRTYGPLTSLFGNPQGRAIARVLDQSILVGNMEQTIGMLSEATGLDYKTIQKSLKRLEKGGLVKKSRKVGNAQTYRFNVENHLHDLVNFARKMQLAADE